MTDDRERAQLIAQIKNLIRYAEWLIEGSVSPDSMKQAINVARNTLREMKS